MPPPFRKLTQHDFAAAVASYPWRPPKTEIHVHCTWRPNHSQYKGLRSIEGMHRFHTVDRGWSDIAQHISIGTEGAIWTGRDWNRTPASASGFSHSGVFMFETIGDFDKGKDPFGGIQAETVFFVCATLQIFFNLPLWWSIRFHNQMTDLKTCPGTAIDRAWFVKNVSRMREQLGDTGNELFGGAMARPSKHVEEFLSDARRAPPEPESFGEEGEHRHDSALEAFMERHHANPFIAQTEGAAMNPSASGALSPTEEQLAAAVNEWRERPRTERMALDPDEDLFAELGRRASLIEAQPARAGELQLDAGPQPEGLGEDFAMLGKRIFKRLVREFASLLCGDGADDASDRAKLRDAFGIGGDVLTAAIASALISGFGLAPAIATIVAALILRRVIMPTVEETCAVVNARIQ